MSAFNVFRIFGDLLHAASSILLIKQIRKNNTAAGISLKTQLIYAFVFITRYVDIFWNFTSFYNWIFKVFYLVTTFATIYYIAFKYKDTYQQTLDSLPVIYIIVPSYIVGLIVARPWTIFEAFWTGSLILESFALLPQFYLLYKSQNIDNFTPDYVACLGAYRFFYILNWIYRTIRGVHIQLITWLTGIVQIGLFSEFFYYWLKSKLSGEKLQLPG